MQNSQTDFYEFQSKEYINWLTTFIKNEPLQMITERSYINVLKNGTELDKRNLLYLDKFCRSLNSYAAENYIHTNILNSSDSEYTVHFALTLKVDDMFLLFESASSTYKSYTFVSTFNFPSENNYIDWDLYSANKRPPQAEKLLLELGDASSLLNRQLNDIISSEFFNELNMSSKEKKELVIKFFLNNINID